MVSTFRCCVCGRVKMEDSPVSLIDMEAGGWKDYCWECGVEELRRRLKGITITIEVPNTEGFTDVELGKAGAAINYSAELINFPVPKRTGE